ncbi:MAG TPA: MdtA/MuxA family multidrug efflux RND transporter periplasmic adaptor subunit [Acetobacteraceae bacterium]|jgi:multidrug efflux system membrane fusion protein
MDERVDPGHTQDNPHLRQTPVVRRSRLASRLFLALLIVAIVGAGLYWWKHHAAKTAAHAPAGHAAQTPPQPVGAATIGTGDIRIVLNELGTVTPLDTVTVMTQINGQLTGVGFKEGQVVRQGDFLAQIDPRPYQVALEQAQGTLARDQGLLAQAKSDLQRYQQLGRQDSIAQQQVSDQRFLVQQYTGTTKTDQAAVDNANLNLAYCHIVSPIDGQVGLRLVDPGNYVQTSNTSGIAVITQMQPMSVIFSVPQQEVPDIVKQMRAGATLTVSAYDQSNTKLLATGQLSTLDNQIDTTTGTLKLRAQFANPNEELYPNEFVNARLLVNTLKNVVRVPVPAVQLGAPGDYVYVIDANDTVAVQPVKLGPTDDGYQQVLSGLTAGQRVVTDGTDRLSAGVKVTVPAPNAAAATGAPTGSGAGQTTPDNAAPQTGQPAPSGQRQGQHQPPKTQ